jgi:hypothetical protein
MQPQSYHDHIIIIVFLILNKTVKPRPCWLQGRRLKTGMLHGPHAPHAPATAAA